MGLLDDNLIERVDKDIYNDCIKRYISFRRVADFLPSTAVCKNIIHDYEFQPGIHNYVKNELYLYILNYLYDYSCYTYDILITKNSKQHIIDKNCKPLYRIDGGRLTMSDILWVCSYSKI